MTLSEHERRELAAIERHFVKEDPGLARKLRSGIIESLVLNVLFAGLMFAGAICGVLFVSAGVEHRSTALIVVGAAATVGGAGVAWVWFSTRRGCR